jgi:type II pantothenate kinase
MFLSNRCKRRGFPDAKEDRAMIIGIDIGSTTTKAVAIPAEPAGINAAGGLIKKVKAKASDAVASATGAFGKLVVENGIKLSGIERIKITGAGAGKIKDDLFGIPTEWVDEITAIGIGGMFLSKKENIIITNIGTGTAIIDAKRSGISHLGGSGVGGGTILGLAKRLLPTAEFNGVMDLAERGNLNQVDLLLEDIMDTDISFLNKQSTASNFGKMLDTAGGEDIALGILNLVFQVIGMLSVFAAKSKNTDRVVITGNGSNNHIGKGILEAIAGMYHIHFEYPADAEYTTAIGAGLF